MISFLKKFSLIGDLRYIAYTSYKYEGSCGRGISVFIKPSNQRVSSYCSANITNTDLLPVQILSLPECIACLSTTIEEGNELF